MLLFCPSEDQIFCLPHVTNDGQIGKYKENYAVLLLLDYMMFQMQFPVPSV